MPFLLNAQTIDDGWFEVGNSNFNATLESIHYIDENTGFAVGSGGTFLKTTDGGFNWSTYDIGLYYHFKKIVFTDSETNGYRYVGAESGLGRIHKTIDSGGLCLVLKTQLISTFRGLGLTKTILNKVY